MHQLETNIALIQQIFEHQPESAVWVQPIWQMDPLSGKSEVADFQFKYCNPASKQISGQEELLDKYIIADKLPDPGASQLIFEQCLTVYHSGEPLEHSYFSDALDKFLTLQRVKVMDGVLTTVRNRTTEYTNQIEKEQQARLLESLVEKSPFGISLYESIRNQNGEITDFKLRMCNKKSAEITAFSITELQTNTVKELMQIRGHSSYFDICKKVVETGEPLYSDYYSPTLDRWMGFSIIKFDDGYLVNYIDITQTKQFELEAKTNAHELNAIFNGSLSGVYTANVLRDEAGAVNDLLFLRANESFYSMFGARPEKIIGNTLSSLSGADDQTAFIQFVQEVLESGKPALHVLEYNNPKRWFEFSMVKLDEETVAITVNDITIQKRNAIEIERQKNLLDTIMRQSPNGLSVTKAIRDNDGKMVDAKAVLLNDACERLNGVPNEVLLSHTFGELSPELLLSPLFTEAAALQTGDSFRTEYYIPLTKKWLELAIAKMDEDHFINVFTDISVIKEVHQELERTIADLKRSNDSLGDFAYAASHDLKEPIRKIRFFTERLRHELKDNLTASQHQVFNRLEMAALRMATLIDDLLAYSEISKAAPEIEEIDLNEKVQLVLEDLELEIQERNAEVTVETLPTIWGHKRQLQQLFQNLVGNALKYSKAEVPPIIRITASKVPGSDLELPLRGSAAEKIYHLIEVHDNGIGFRQEDAERIFNVFTRLHGNAEYKGSGIGLSTVRKVVENHAGFIWAESQPDEGATFKILLPLE